LYTLAPPSDDMAGVFLNWALSERSDDLVKQAGFVDLAPELGAAPQLDRLDKALLVQEADFDAIEFKRVVVDMHGTRRLSTTFRFKPNVVELDNRALADLTRLSTALATMMANDPGMTVRVAGFTDPTGSRTLNVALAKSRAAIVRDAIAARMPQDFAKRIRPDGYGPLLPITCNDTSEGRERNRRVEVWVRRGR
jgi:phosphate transport system substrate-binding protein